jgi:uncharacterized protein (DUF885 family)
MLVGLALSLGAAMFDSTVRADEDARLADFFKSYLDEFCRLRPYEATRLGEHRYDHQLEDLSPESRAKWIAHLERAKADLEKHIDPAKLSRSGQIDREILLHHFERSLWHAAHVRPFENDPRIYNDYIADSIYALFTQSTLPAEQNLKNAIERMAYIPRVVTAAKASLKSPPRVVVETAIKQNKGAIAFYEHGLFELVGETPQLSDLRPPARKIVEALKDYQKFLETELLPRAKGDWRLGKEKFAKKLELDLEANYAADDVLRDAEAEADRVEREMVVIARQLWATVAPGKPIPPDDADGRRELVRRVLAHYDREHGKVENLVKDATAMVADIKKFITDNDILKLPDPDRCRIVEMPEFQRGNSVAYLNNAPPLDAKAASFYAIAPPPKDWDARRVSSYMEEYNARMLQILTIHEAYPGHYVQIEYSNRHPSLIRKVLFSGVFAEGWAVYVEQMMLDQGYAKGDLPLRLYQLKWYLRTVCNAILDHRMHCTDMTDEQAMDLLTRRAFQSEGEAVGKTIRAKQSSCQLSTYFVGRMAFYRLRQQVQRQQGEHFQLGRFHEAVLSHGTLPVKYLPELLNVESVK